MISIATNSDIKVPVYDENIENIKDYMSYYKFFVKEIVQEKNFLKTF